MDIEALPLHKKMIDTADHSTHLLYSEYEYPMLTNQVYEEKKYPEAVLDEDFYNQHCDTFKAKAWWKVLISGASLYHYTDTKDPHVGFFFRQPIHFINLANQYGVTIKNHLIACNEIQGKFVQRADISTRHPDEVLKGEKVDISLLLRGKRKINPDEFHWYNREKNQYDPYVLAMSIIIANNVHFEKYFRENGLVCYTFCRDVILIYNALFFIKKNKMLSLCLSIFFAAMIGLSVTYVYTLKTGLVSGAACLVIFMIMTHMLFVDKPNQLGISLDLSENNYRLISLLISFKQINTVKIQYTHMFDIFKLRSVCGSTNVFSHVQFVDLRGNDLSILEIPETMRQLKIVFPNATFVHDKLTNEMPPLLLPLQNGFY
jgi:hypothetical protein